MRVHGEPRYLIPESINLLEHAWQIHPLLVTLALLAVFGVAYGILRRLFGRSTYDMVVFALIISAILIVISSALYTLTHVPGFHLGG